MSDKSLRSEVLAALHRMAAGATIAVTAKDGMVTLAGRVGAPIDRLRLHSAASRVASVRAVVDHLDFEGDEAGDATTARAALERLEGFKGLPNGALRLVVRDAVVTLSGEVPDQAQRTLLEQELLNLPEVTDVRNQLQVALPGGDARARLAEMLAWEGASVQGLEVREADGVISLAGDAEGWFDRDAAERLAWTLPGVRSVVNQVALPAGAAEPDGDAPVET